MKRKNSIKNIFAVSGVLLLILSASPVHAEDNTATTGDVKIYELDMNDQNPLETLKEDVINNRANFDAAVNLSQIDLNASTITTEKTALKAQQATSSLKQPLCAWYLQMALRSSLRQKKSP